MAAQMSWVHALKAIIIEDTVNHKESWACGVAV